MDDENRKNWYNNVGRRLCQRERQKIKERERYEKET